MKSKDIVRISVVLALYVALTLIFGFMSFGNLQFRIAEILLFLCFFRKDYAISIILGCFISNLFSPLGLVDAIFGTCATILSVGIIIYCKNIYLSIVSPVVINGLVVGYELNYVLGLPIFYSMISVALCEFAVLLLGLLLVLQLRKNEEFLKLIDANQNI